MIEIILVRLASVLAILFLVAVVGFMIRVAVSGKGEITPFFDKNGEVLKNSIAEKSIMEIDERKNGLIIRGKSITNPVILFISGGPGIPQYWLNEYYHNKIEEYYTVCWWEWNGEGMAYDPNLKKDDITIERLMHDAKKVAKYLKQRFEKEKIYLMAHSGGTPLGLRLAQEDAEDFYAYFAMGQVINENECRYIAGYEYLEPYFREKGDNKSLRKLNQLMQKDKDTIAGSWEKLLLSAGCGTTREMRSDAIGIFFPQMFSKCYTWNEKIDYWKGKSLNSGTPYHKNIISLSEKGTVIPIYFISGKYDYTCPVSLAEQLYRNIDAPEKEFFCLDQSAHSPLWEENDKVIDIMRKKTEENKAE